MIYRIHCTSMYVQVHADDIYVYFTVDIPEICSIICALSQGGCFYLLYIMSNIIRMYMYVYTCMYCICTNDLLIILCIQYRSVCFIFLNYVCRFKRMLPISFHHTLLLEDLL